jgi:SPP1 gp7 family putative phage head morphogenesis protein
MLRKKKAPRWIYPVAIEHTYATDVSAQLKTIVVSVLSKLEKRLPTWVRLNSHDVKLDSPEAELEEILKTVEEEIASMFAVGYGMAEVFGYVESVANRIFAFEQSQMQRQLMLVLGTPLNVESSWWPEAKKLWVNENHRLIKSLSQEYITKLNTVLSTGFQSGWSFEEMVDEIQKLSDKMVGYRARLIARDQVGKLQYAITRKQFEAIGMDGYYWVTARDERVRGNPLGKFPKAIPSHWIMEGKICKFSDPNVYSDLGYEWLPRTALMPGVHPGQAILCRCTATPYWLPLIDEAIQSIR